MSNSMILALLKINSIIMATVEMDNPSASNLQSTTLRVPSMQPTENYISFRPPAQSPNPPDYLEPHYFTTGQDKPNLLQGILCSINPSKDKTLNRDVDMLKDRTQTFAINLDNQIHKFIQLGSKLGLSFNSTSKTFTNQFDIKQCISMFVDLVPTKAIDKIKDRITEQNHQMFRQL